MRHRGTSGAPRLLGRLPRGEAVWVADLLRRETAGGGLMLLAATAALAWANLAPAGYVAFVHQELGPARLGLRMDVAHWAADGLLAVFFLVAGLELKRELVVGQLRRPAQALLPIVAAVTGMLLPALVYLAVNALAGGDVAGWAIPTATDIAFALAVLAVVGSALPTALRAFLLTLAVVDDLLAIVIIALFFTDDLAPLPLLGAAGLLAGYAWLQRRGGHALALSVPLVLVAWWLTYVSGVHATVAGVAVGLLTRVRPLPGDPAAAAPPDDSHDSHDSPAERLAHAVQPWSAGLCVPLFALTNAGIPLSGKSVVDTLTHPVGLGVILGLVVGKTVGVLGGTWLTARYTRAELDADLAWLDVLAVSVLGGVGFTVSLLIAELSFPGPANELLAKAGVVIGSGCAAVLAAGLLAVRSSTYRRLAERGAAAGEP
jgi:NhaA family Na+:H+ antiporter